MIDWGDIYKHDELKESWGYVKCVCGHSSLHHEFPNFIRWFINQFKGGYRKNGERCKAPKCNCRRVVRC